MEYVFLLDTTDGEDYVVGQDYTPTHTGNRGSKIAWDHTSRFSILGFAPEGKVFYEYSLQPLNEEYFQLVNIYARGDLDNDGAWSIFRFWRDQVSTLNDIQHSGSPF